MPAHATLRRGCLVETILQSPTAQALALQPVPDHVTRALAFRPLRTKGSYLQWLTSTFSSASMAS